VIDFNMIIDEGCFRAVINIVKSIPEKNGFFFVLVFFVCVCLFLFFKFFLPFLF